eukprot:768221-Hanusia_phi.AAC.13
MDKTASSQGACTRLSCGSGLRCQDASCTSQPMLSVLVTDRSWSGQDSLGVKYVGVRIASPTAIRDGKHSNFFSNDMVDLSYFKLASLTIPSYLPVGGTPSGDKIQFPADFDGYSEPGTWYLDSVLLEDNAGNAALMSKDDLQALGAQLSISVRTLEISKCAGTCSENSNSCRLFRNAISPDTWWVCDSKPDDVGVCCTTCPTLRSTTDGSVYGECKEAGRAPVCGCRANSTGRWTCQSDQVLNPASGIPSPCATSLVDV